MEESDLEIGDTKEPGNAQEHIQSFADKKNAQIAVDAVDGQQPINQRNIEDRFYEIDAHGAYLLIQGYQYMIDNAIKINEKNEGCQQTQECGSAFALIDSDAEIFGKTKKNTAGAYGEMEC